MSIIDPTTRPGIIGPDPDPDFEVLYPKDETDVENMIRYIRNATEPGTVTNGMVAYVMSSLLNRIDNVEAPDIDTSDIEALITAEETARIAADNALGQRISNEETARNGAIIQLRTMITTLLSDEETARIAADNALGTRISNEETARNGMFQQQVPGLIDDKLNPVKDRVTTLETESIKRGEDGLVPDYQLDKAAIHFHGYYEFQNGEAALAALPVLEELPTPPPADSTYIYVRFTTNGSQGSQFIINTTPTLPIASAKLFASWPAGDGIRSSADLNKLRLSALYVCDNEFYISNWSRTYLYKIADNKLNADDQKKLDDVIYDENQLEQTVGGISNDLSNLATESRNNVKNVVITNEIINANKPYSTVWGTVQNLFCLDYIAIYTGHTDNWTYIPPEVTFPNSTASSIGASDGIKLKTFIDRITSSDQYVQHLYRRIPDIIFKSGNGTFVTLRFMEKIDANTICFYPIYDPKWGIWFKPYLELHTKDGASYATFHFYPEVIDMRMFGTDDDDSLNNNYIYPLDKTGTTAFPYNFMDGYFSEQVYNVFLHAKALIQRLSLYDYYIRVDLFNTVNDSGSDKVRYSSFVPLPDGTGNVRLKLKFMTSANGKYIAGNWEKFTVPSAENLTSNALYGVKNGSYVKITDANQILLATSRDASAASVSTLEDSIAVDDDAFMVEYAGQPTVCEGGSEIGEADAIEIKLPDSDDEGESDNENEITDNTEDYE